MKENERAAIESLAVKLKGKKLPNEEGRVDAGKTLSQDELKDLAKVALRETVNVWAAEFVGSGLYDLIYQSLRDEAMLSSQNVYRVSLSREIVHPWRGKLYTASLFVRGDKYEPRLKSPTCTIGRRPLFGMNWVVAMGDRDRELQCSLTRPEELLEQAHPIVTLEFAQQIKDGTVWDQIGRSLHYRPTRSATEEDRKEYGRSRDRLRDQYVAKWGSITE